MALQISNLLQLIFLFSLHITEMPVLVHRLPKGNFSFWSLPSVSASFSKQAAYSSAGTGNDGKFTLPDLPYSYEALEPVLTRKIMFLHHAKHHAAYVSNLNAALSTFSTAKSSNDVTGMTNALQAIKFNAGGHINHSIFWKNLCPPKDALGRPEGSIGEGIKKDFGGFDEFKKLFMKESAAIQGSGWGWLVKQDSSSSLPSL